MTVDVGQKLDKYELLEEVGQGGMAVVYRGRDTALKREVAVKVLHRHLADDRESRARFEREAQAVAKLRHENILEIFDFSGLGSDESYIVTEFIDGQTLKEFVLQYEIRFPEVGAMIVAQVLHALAHAHAAGILHRDVKPENIMVRGDGVVKLTDFGIAQMVDLQRMTVTGQLLGSPAYMSPEHVSGGTLDFRTDVFSVGILLYQLVTGSLPFTGKNPHEILKRIAECQYRAPQLLNPLVGERLGRIITRALAREKNDRYPDVSGMREDLLAFLEASQLTDVPDELARFFAGPAAYEMALERRLLAAWSECGKALWDEKRALALDYYNRALTLDPDNAVVLAVLDRASRRRRRWRLTGLFGGVGAIVVSALLFHGGAHEGDAAIAAVGRRAAAARPDAAQAVVPDASSILAAGDGGPNVATVPRDAALPPDAAPERAGDGPEHRGVRRPGRGRPAARPDAGPHEALPSTGPTRKITLQVFPPNSEVQVEGGAWMPIPGRTIVLDVPAAATRVSVRNQACCQSEARTIAADAQGAKVDLAYLPGTVIPECDASDVEVTIDEQPAHLGHPSTIPLDDTVRGSRTVTVEFIRNGGQSGIDSHSVTVHYRQQKRVECAF